MELLAKRVEFTYKLPPLLSQVHGHLVVRLKNITKMLNIRYPWKWILVQDHWSNFPGVNWSSGENDAFGFRLNWIYICAELEPFLLSKVFTDLHQLL